MPRDLFDSDFALLTGRAPFPWQKALYRRLIAPDSVERIPATCDLPTGLGKTSVIAIWLLALAYHAKKGAAASFPRRLVYVVNRRTVVDQSTREAEQLRKRLLEEPNLVHIREALLALCGRGAKEGAPLAISTLRGQFADNAEWRDDPSRPAVVVGTVDMIGSRLLFSGYGRGFRSRPLHAAFLGQDVLLIHDEAHLEPAFQKLIEAICAEQRRTAMVRSFHVMALSATARSTGARFGFTKEDLHHPEVLRRLKAKKGLRFHTIDDEKKLSEEIARLATRKDLLESHSAILIYLRRLDDVSRVAERIQKAKYPVVRLTGTLRGRERDALATTDPIFARFLSEPPPSVEPTAGTVFLISTSAGEVGANLSADHLICDLTPFDSMAQRLGRVNRFGRKDAQVEVVVPRTFDAVGTSKDTAELRRARERTFQLLGQLPTTKEGRLDASSHGLRTLPAEECLAAFTPSPEILETSPLLFDAWSLTTIKGRLPGRPPVSVFLHGVAEWEPPQTQVAWRSEVELLKEEALENTPPSALLEDYALKPHELIRDRTDRVHAALGEIAERLSPGVSPNVWLLDEDGDVEVMALDKLVASKAELLANRTVLLGPRLGGLREGQLVGSAAYLEDEHYDVSDEWWREDGTARRSRVWNDDQVPEGMRLVRVIHLPDSTEDDEPTEYTWRWFVRPRSADEEGSRYARTAQELAEHLSAAESACERLGEQLLPEPEARAAILAAKWHDLGKNRTVWQRSIGNFDPKLVLAKSGRALEQVDELTHYRHELGSLSDVQALADFQRLDAESQDLVLHLIAAHHGRARPHFPRTESFDPERPSFVVTPLILEAPRRFARLQRKYGRWGLAYLESIVRAADILASQQVDETLVAERESAG